MSSQNKTPFCPVCYDLGKPESVYTSHWLRETPDKDSKIVCKTLQTMKCNYCKEKGHTIKYCPVLAKKHKLKSQRDIANHVEQEKNMRINPFHNVLMEPFYYNIHIDEPIYDERTGNIYFMNAEEVILAEPTKQLIPMTREDAIAMDEENMRLREDAIAMAQENTRLYEAAIRVE